MLPTLNPPPSSLPIPSLWVVPVHQPKASGIVLRTWTGDSFHIWYYTCFNAILPNHPTLSLSHRVQKTILYISVSFAVSYTGMYFFIANFPSLKICYLSVTLPRILVNLWTQDRRSVSLLSCAIKRASSLFREPRRCTSWQLGLWPRVSMCSLWAALCSWPTGRASTWLLAPGRVKFQSRQHRHARCPNCPSVLHTRSTISVTFPVDHPGLWGHCA